jgi:hypothetical protein
MPTTKWEHEKPTNSPVRRQPLRVSSISWPPNVCWKTENQHSTAAQVTSHPLLYQPHPDILSRPVLGLAPFDISPSSTLLWQTFSYFFLWEDDFDSFSLLEAPFPSLL